MKKILALFVCAALLFALAACSNDTEPTEATPTVADSNTPTEASNNDNPTVAPTETPTEEEHNHAHVSYKGLVSADFTLADMEAAEGRAPDFTVEQGDTTLYIYNNVTMDDLTFTQVQFTYGDAGNRISCTYTGDSGLDAVMDEYREAMTAIYGAANVDSPDAPTFWTWRDGHTTNYVMLTQINDTTVQLAFYIAEGAQ